MSKRKELVDFIENKFNENPNTAIIIKYSYWIDYDDNEKFIGEDVCYDFRSFMIFLIDWDIDKDLISGQYKYSRMQIHDIYIAEKLKEFKFEIKEDC